MFLGTDPAIKTRSYDEVITQLITGTYPTVSLTMSAARTSTSIVEDLNKPPFIEVLSAEVSRGRQDGHIMLFFRVLSYQTSFFFVQESLPPPYSDQW